MLVVTVTSLAVINSANNIRQLLIDSDSQIFFTPVDDDLFADTNVEGFPAGEGDAPTNTPPFDLGELGDTREIDLEKFPSGNQFLEDILNGQFEFPDAEEGGSYFLPIEGVSTFREVEIADAQGTTLGEFDVIDLNRNVFIEKKSATGLNIVNPNTGLPAQTPQQFVDKQIVVKTRTRITRLNEEATTTVVTTNGTQTIPELTEIIDIKEFIFELEGDSPELRDAVENGLNNLREEFPDYKFSANFGA